LCFDSLVAFYVSAPILLTLSVVTTLIPPRFSHWPYLKASAAYRSLDFPFPFRPLGLRLLASYWHFFIEELWWAPLSPARSRCRPQAHSSFLDSLVLEFRHSPGFNETSTLSLAVRNQRRSSLRLFSCYVRRAPLFSAFPFSFCCPPPAK